MSEQAKFDTVYQYLVNEAVKHLGVSERTAHLRINAIRKSGILTELGPPDGQAFQIGIDVAMRIPQLGEKEDNI